MRKAFRLLVAVAIVAAVSVGVLSVFTEAQARPGCICPLYYAPVKCDNGKVYSNQCFANCAHAKNCVPIGPGPIEL
jgi:hypothetical protein